MQPNGFITLKSSEYKMKNRSASVIVVILLKLKLKNLFYGLFNCKY